MSLCPSTAWVAPFQSGFKLVFWSVPLLGGFKNHGLYHNVLMRFLRVSRAVRDGGHGAKLLQHPAGQAPRAGGELPSPARGGLCGRFDGTGRRFGPGGSRRGGDFELGRRRVFGKPKIEVASLKGELPLLLVGR